MIVALDPGATTGIAYYDETQNKFYTAQLEHDKYPHPHEILFDTLTSLKPNAIVYESFLHRHKTGVIYDGVQYSGVIELWAELHGVPVVKYNSGYGKAFWKDDKIKRMALWVPGKKHAMDAMRHLLNHLMKTNKAFALEATNKLRLEHAE